MALIVTWKKNGMRLRVLGEVTGRFGELRLQVQKETAEGMHGLFSLRPDEVEGFPSPAYECDDDEDLADCECGWGPFAERGKRNTCGTPSKSRRQRIIAAIEAHVERHPSDHMSRERIAKLKAMP